MLYSELLDGSVFCPSPSALALCWNKGEGKSSWWLQKSLLERASTLPRAISKWHVCWWRCGVTESQNKGRSIHPASIDFSGWQKISMFWFGRKNVWFSFCLLVVAVFSSLADSHFISFLQHSSDWATPKVLRPVLWWWHVFCHELSKLQKPRYYYEL